MKKMIPSTLNMSLLTLMVLTASTVSLAAGPVGFKNFSPGKDGVWETTTTTAVSPQPVVQKTCVDVAQSKSMVAKMLANPSPMAKCKVNILKDTKDAAEVQQDCVIANFNSKLTTKMKRISDDAYETQVDSETAGKHTSAKMVSRFLGPCSADDKKAQSSKMTERCSSCKGQVEKMKLSCNKAAAAQKEICDQSVQQLEMMCKASCP